MRTDAIRLEEIRLKGIDDIADYPNLHERHRIFPAIFENRNHRKILDIAAGVGVVGKRILDNYKVPDSKFEVVCNDVSPTCLRILKKAGLRTTSFNIDDEKEAFPIPDKTFDAIIALATIEHVIYIDHFLEEVYRILEPDGYLYLSAPNYSGLLYLLPFIWSGKTFHDPMQEDSRYEFYAHVRYFTYKTLCNFISPFGFTLDTVYIGSPNSSSRYKALYSRSKLKALVFRGVIKFASICLSPRWASEPVLCFRKSKTKDKVNKPRKVVL
jgi:ubiquinone/menaquinone biosynthesis C-methylase UbiE